VCEGNTFLSYFFPQRSRMLLLRLVEHCMALGGCVGGKGAGQKVITWRAPPLLLPRRVGRGGTMLLRHSLSARSPFQHRKSCFVAMRLYARSHRCH
jgi:hypothetical protein